MKNLIRKASVCQCLLLGSLVGSHSLLAEEPPNILLIMVDDSGYTDPGSYGGEIDTPFLDRLAKKGMRFSNFYTAGRCTPTRASLLTGRDSAHAGFAAGSLGGWPGELKLPSYRGRLPAELPTLAELLKNTGYQTLMAGKWHLGGSRMKLDPALQAAWKRTHPGWELTEEEVEADFMALPKQRGFDRFFGMIPGEADFFFLPGEKHPYLEGNDPAELNYSRTYTIDFSEPRRSNYSEFKHHGKTTKAFYDTDGLTDRALEMLQETDKESPFFLYLAYRAPHMPLQAPKELVDKYMERYADTHKVESDRVAGLVREGLFPPTAGFVREPHSETSPADRFDRDSFQRQCAVHAAMVECIDQNVGRIVDLLEASGRLDNTLILYLSDNGAAAHVSRLMNTPYRGAKAELWEGGTRTHLIAHWPARIPSGQVSHAVGWVGEILPTALDIAGTAYPKKFKGRALAPPDGRSLLPALIGKEMAPPEYLFFNDRGQQSVIYQGRWKLLIEPGWYVDTSQVPGIVYELYDLQQDPAETNNLADAFPDKVEKLAAECAAWQQRCGIRDYAEVRKMVSPWPGLGEGRYELW